MRQFVLFYLHASVSDIDCNSNSGLSVVFLEQHILFYLLFIKTTSDDVSPYFIPINTSST